MSERILLVVLAVIAMLDYPIFKKLFGEPGLASDSPLFQKRYAKVASKRFKREIKAAQEGVDADEKKAAEYETEKIMSVRMDFDESIRWFQYRANTPVGNIPLKVLTPSTASIAIVGEPYRALTESGYKGLGEDYLQSAISGILDKFDGYCAYLQTVYTLSQEQMSGVNQILTDTAACRAQLQRYQEAVAEDKQNQKRAAQDRIHMTANPYFLLPIYHCVAMMERNFEYIRPIWNNQFVGKPLRYVTQNGEHKVLDTERHRLFDNIWKDNHYSIHVVDGNTERINDLPQDVHWDPRDSEANTMSVRQCEENMAQYFREIIYTAVSIDEEAQ